MEDFDERVQAYFEKLRSNPGLLENIMKNTKAIIVCPNSFWNSVNPWLLPLFIIR